jgi:uncharacterized integral membrane protein (TIGR00698 family)
MSKLARMQRFLPLEKVARPRSMAENNSDTASPPTTSRTAWWQNEDWLAVIAAVPLIAAVVYGWKVQLPKLTWTSDADLGATFSSTNLIAIAATSMILIVLASLVLAPSLGKKALPFLGGACVVFALAWLAQWLAANAVIKSYGLEYVIFALALGLLWSNFLPIPEWLASAVRTEFFIKTGIVILGCGMLFSDLISAGAPGMIQALLVIPVVWYVTFFLARRLKVDDEFGVMLSTSVSICGVSAAIAACGAIQGDKKKLSYVTSVVLLCAVPMMILMPWCVKWLGLGEEIGGAWLGGTLDSTGSVVAASKMVGETATNVGTVVKLSQNVLIGVAAFILSVWWTMRSRSKDASAPKADFGVIWERFPKFVLGFIGASLVFSFLLDPKVAKDLDKSLRGLREIWFAAAFVSIGLETRLSDLAKLGGARPAIAFLGGQAVNILWTLLLAWLLFGVLF